ncbi:glucosaminidase domain-containing protein [Stackebrandtia nassauensis]|uniref:Mannosyl-glycoprotein endo-beta-N-acetylglucosamidase n=1 Tax=Stackebrandtia nassauensis (strain DSM 44728 / CIP 108903 / NRRL B-16338 / NBRC 102104 / LLR-40K-21) TaxID=446470 RepID=D3Q873_STANL|nr:glucosaminidase domain-containing protein [Stackebrandtia nassauensis]ADD42447.1 Mannosyl-glycoprotein endo-beta-N-acetylglucosamidase [Stackebrandtia nassauensis DSM 44728]
MHIDVSQVQNTGQRIGRVGADAESYLRTMSGPLQQSTQANTGFSAVQRLRQVLDTLAKQTGELITGTNTTAGNVGKAAQAHARAEQRNQRSMRDLNQQLAAKNIKGPKGSGGSTPSKVPTPTPNPLREVLGPGGKPAEASPTQIAPASGKPGSRQEFINNVGNAAKAGQERFGVPASVASAQAILESGWGKSGLAQEANNYFGIKCADGDPGSTASSCVNYKTWEVINGNDTTVRDAFRAYDSPSDSFLDHGQFLSENPRYAEAFKHTDDPDQFIREVHKAGYATDPGYADKIIGLMQKYDLYRFNQ